MSSNFGLPSCRHFWYLPLSRLGAGWYVITSAFTPPPSTERNRPTSPFWSSSSPKCAAAYARLELGPLLALLAIDALWDCIRAASRASRRWGDLESEHATVIGHAVFLGPRLWPTRHSPL